MSKPTKLITHRDYILSVWRLIRKRKELTAQDRERMDRVYLTYGTGEPGLRGATYYDKWQYGVDASGKACKHVHKGQCGALLTLCATGQESVTQLAGTTCHEAAHAIAGPENRGHGPAWKEACARVGLPSAVNGTTYTWDSFDAPFARLLKALPVPNDGKPRSLADVIEGFRKAGIDLPPSLANGPLPSEPRIKPCSQGFGTRGGTSRGKGAGSRHYRYLAEHKADCKAPRPKLNCGYQDLAVTCTHCGVAFVLDETYLPPSTGMGPSGQGVPATVARAHGARKAKTPRKSRAKGAAHKTGAPVRAHAKAVPATPKARRRKAAQAGQAPITLAAVVSSVSLPVPPKVESQTAVDAALTALKAQGKLLGGA